MNELSKATWEGIKKSRMLTINRIESFYYDLQVLRQVSITVNENEIVALFGPNGHGKSTLLKNISGLHPIVSGSIHFRGIEISKLPAHKIVKLGISYISETRDLFPDLTVEENLRMGAYTLSNSQKVKENFEFVYELFPRLAERRRQQCHSLSGGEGRMVAIGRGLMSSAKMLLVDEPSIGLAPALCKIVFDALQKINRENKITILIVEQEIGNALSMADRVYLLKKGQILLERAVKEVNVKMIEQAYF